LLKGGGNFPHYHYSFSETFTVIDGELTVQYDKEMKRLFAKQSFEVPPGTLHCFKNKSQKATTFFIELRPGHTGFENALKIAYGLATDGLTNKKGIPSSIIHTAILLKIGDSKLPGAYSLLTPLLKWLANRATKKGIEQELISRYCN
jgi:hypothetical protein